VRLQDLSLVLPQSVDLGLLPVTAAFSASRDNPLRSRPRRRPRPRFRPRGVLRQVKLHPRIGLGTLEIFGSGFEMIRISQGESPRVFRIGPEWREAALQEREAKLLDMESRLKLAALMPEARVALPAVREPILTAPTLRRKKPDCFRSRKDDCVDRE